MKELLLFLLLVSVLLTPDLTEARQTYDPQQVLAMIEKGELLQAEQAINMASGTQRSEAVWHYSKGRLAFARQQYSDSIKDFEQAASLDPQSVEYVIAVGYANCAEAKEANLVRSPFLARKCKAAYEKALELDSRNLNAINNLIVFHMEAPGIVGGSMAEAERLTEELMTIDLFHGYTGRLRLALNKTDTTAALIALNEGAKVLPDSVFFPVNLGLLLGEMGKYAEAYRELSRAKDIRPEDPMVHFYYGRLSGLSGENLDSGLESLNLIIESYTDKIPEIIHSMTYVMMGRIYVKKGETDTARTAFENALKIRYDNPVAGAELQKL